MRGIFLALFVTAGLAPAVSAADPPQDTPAAAFARTHRLKARISVDFRDRELADAIRSISEVLEERKLGPLLVRYGPGASQTARVTLAMTDQPVAAVLDGLLKPLNLGYVVVSRKGDRADGWLHLATGSERGYPPGVTPPPETSAEDEKAAADKLELARRLRSEGKSDRADTVLRFIIRQYPATRAGIAAKNLLGKKKS